MDTTAVEKRRERQARYRAKEETRAKRKLWDATYRQTHAGQLQEYQKDYYENNHEVRRSNADSWRLANLAKRREQQRAYNRRRREALRESLFALLGRQCASCGFADTRALQIDHKNGGGNIEWQASKSPAAYYQAILDRQGEGFQILCANCNQIKRIERKEHTQRRK